MNYEEKLKLGWSEIKENKFSEQISSIKILTNCSNIINGMP